MTDWSDETLRPLDELARIAFPENSGVSADTLKRRARKGQLRVYRPGKAFLSTLADVRAMLDATQVKPAQKRTDRPTVPNGLGLTQHELSSLALERVLQDLREQTKERKRLRDIERAEEEWERKYEARKAARKPPRAK